MAGFFGFFDYTKPGPGVPKDAPPKHPFIVFFEVYSRKFWNLVKINMMFNIFNLPALLAVLVATMFIIPSNIGDDPLLDLITRFILGTIILCVPLITVGPAQAGFTYVLRNYAREEHAFIWGDFKEHALKNLKQSLLISFIDFVIVIIMGITINFYLSYGQSNIFTAFASGLIIMAFVIFMMMHMYIYPMLVTFKLSIKQIYRNAFLFAIVKFIPNLGIILMCTLILLVSFYFNAIIGFILFAFISVSTIGLITNFYVYPKLKRYMIDKVDQENNLKDKTEENGEINA